MEDSSCLPSDVHGLDVVFVYLLPSHRSMSKPGAFARPKSIRGAVFANCPSYIPVTDDCIRSTLLLWPAKYAETSHSVVNRQSYPHPIGCAQPPFPDTCVVVLSAEGLNSIPPLAAPDGRDQVNASPPSICSLTIVYNNRPKIAS